jgi:CheY-like chemotaxis protein
MRETLTSAGYEVDDAGNGMEGLEKVRDFRPDLVLLDINIAGDERSQKSAAPFVITRTSASSALRFESRMQMAALDAPRRRLRDQTFSTPGTPGSRPAPPSGVCRRTQDLPPNSSSTTRHRLRCKDGSARTEIFISPKGTGRPPLSDTTCRPRHPRTGNSCKRCGARTTVIKWTISVSS